MDLESQRKITAILRLLAEAGRPLGSLAIARGLQSLGIDLKERMVRYYLDQMDRDGLTENLGRPGRTITDRGRKELETAVAVDKVGFISAKVDELSYRMCFDLHRRTGTVILNVSSIDARQFPRAQRLVNLVLDAGLGMGRFIGVARAGEVLGRHRVPEGKVAIGTICSVTLNGILRVAGIPTGSRFGGLLELREGQPLRFTQIINYDGTTLDPVEIFIKGKMTSVGKAARTGTGTIGASFREIPAAALADAEAVIRRLGAAGLGGVLAVGRPGRALLDVPVQQGRVGLIVAAGLNAIAVLEEEKIDTENHAMATLCEFERLIFSANFTDAT